MAEVIKKNVKSRKAPGFDLITSEILKQWPHKRIVKLTNLINAAICLKHVAGMWKIAEVIMITNAGSKQPNKASSYWRIFLLPMMSSLSVKLFLKRLKPIIEKKELILMHQLGFKNGDYHRLSAFDHNSDRKSNRKNKNMLCSIFSSSAGFR